MGHDGSRELRIDGSLGKCSPVVDELCSHQNLEGIKIEDRLVWDQNLRMELG
jgi:hypothetical protein